MKCYEDNQTPRFAETLLLFSEIVNSKWYISKPIILILNKYDIFRKKIRHKNINVYFKDYHGTSEKDAVEYIIKQFEDRIKDKKRLYTYVLSAIGKIWYSLS
jgi:guanine nucleotide-binding protein G(i) subunit alpha